MYFFFLRSELKATSKHSRYWEISRIQLSVVNVSLHIKCGFNGPVDFLLSHKFLYFQYSKQKQTFYFIICFKYSNIKWLFSQWVFFWSKKKLYHLFLQLSVLGVGEMIQQLWQLLFLQKTPVWFPVPMSSGLQPPAIAVPGQQKSSRLTYLNTHAKNLHVQLTKNNPLKNNLALCET